MIDLEIGGIAVPIDAKHQVDQDYEDIRASTTHRMKNGSAVRQQRWSKIRTTIRGSGWTPVGLSGLDYSQPMMLKCIGERAVAGATTTITLPGGYRTDGDYAPRGYAIVGDELEETSISVTGGVATLGTVSGAAAYHVIYYPEITVYAEFNDSFSLSSADFDWALECEEV